MSDNKSKQNVRDDARIDLNDPAEVAFAAEKEGVSADDYRTMARKSESSSRPEIADYIRNSKS